MRSYKGYPTVDLDPLRGESVQRRAGVEAALVEDRHPSGQRVQDVPQQSRGTRHRQRVDDPSAGPKCRLGDGEIGNKVECAAMGENDTLWARSGSAGIDDLGDVVRVRVRSARKSPMLLVAQCGEVFETPQGSRGSLDGRRDPVMVRVTGKNEARCGVVDQIAQLLGGEAVVERDNDRPDLERSDRRNDPLQAVVADDADPVPGLSAAVAKCSAAQSVQRFNVR